MMLTLTSLLIFIGPCLGYAEVEGEVLKKSLLTSYTSLSSHIPGEVTLPELPLEKLNSLYQETLNNPVSHLSRLSKYDPTGIVGFCFGRAMAAHLTARKEFHVSPTAIYKLFIIGDLRSVASKPEWRFHVTTILPVKSDGGTTWMAIDPIMKQPLTVAEWMMRVRRGWDTWHGVSGGKAKFFLVSNEAILPDIRVLPEPETGDRIIELNFVPESSGILPSTEWSSTLQTKDIVYELNEREVRRFFLVAKRSSKKTLFSFSGIKINAQYIPYNNYFSDLLAAFTTIRPGPSEGPRFLSEMIMAPEDQISVPGPMGFDLSRIPKATLDER
jgi:hypothetical protein